MSGRIDGGSDGAGKRSAGAELLRRCAREAGSLREMWSLMASMPYGQVKALAEEFADLLDDLAARRGGDAQRPASSEGGQPAGGAALADAPSGGTSPSSSHSGAGTSEPASAEAPASSTISPSENPSAPRKLIVFSDGAARGNPGPSGAGGVLMLPDGKIVARLGKYLGSQTNNHAEYTALIMVLTAALKLGATEVEAISDSELMVKQMNGIYKVKNADLKALHDEAKGLMARFRKASIRHVLREFNKEADEMSNRAIDERM